MLSVKFLYVVIGLPNLGAKLFEFFGKFSKTFNTDWTKSNVKMFYGEDVDSAGWVLPVWRGWADKAWLESWLPGRLWSGVLA